MGPQTGFTGSAFSMQTTLVGGHLAQNGPQDRENPLFGVFAPFQAPHGAAKFLSVPQTPQKPVNRELRPQEAEPLEVARVRKLRNANALLMSQKFPENSPVAPSYGQKRAQKRPDWVSAQFQAKFGPILTDFGPTTKKIDQ